MHRTIYYLFAFLLVLGACAQPAFAQSDDLKTEIIKVLVGTAARAFKRPSSSEVRGGSTKDSNVVYLSDVKPTALNERDPTRNSLESEYLTGEALIRGREFKRSISVGGYDTRSRSYFCSVAFITKRQYDFFDADVGVDDSYNERMPFTFIVQGDGKQLLKVDLLKLGSDAKHIHVPIRDVARLELEIQWTDSRHKLDPGCVWWGDARLIKGDSPPPPPPDSQDGSAAGKVLRLDPEKLKELVAELKQEVLTDPDLSRSRPTLAIAAFKLIPANLLAPSNADAVREDLTTALIKTRTFDVVERAQLDKALKELKIQLSDTFDSATAQKLGRMVGARAVLIGSISDRGTYTVINARLIDTETGKARVAASVELRQ